MKRPIVWIFSILISIFLIVRFFYGDYIDKSYYQLDKFFDDEISGNVSGTFDYMEKTKKNYKIYLKKVSVNLNSSKKTYSFSNFLIFYDKKINLNPGNIVLFSGNILKLSAPTNQGQFDERAYYKEKNIYYKCFASNYKVVKKEVDLYKKYLYKIKSDLAKTYDKCLPKKEAGIISAMLLGEKSSLDLDIKELYQTNGIGHLLAISGLHISLLSIFVYSIFSRLNLKSPIPFIATFVFLISYGTMTGFSLSTNRAVIMMIMALFAREILKSYDGLTAMALSAIIILLNKPYAVNSCSFLLSYSAVFGVYIVNPSLKSFFLGTLFEQEKSLRKDRRKKLEHKANYKLYFIEKHLVSLKSTLINTFMCSLSIWLFTLPVVLWFFYEIPTYGIIINVFILPLATILVLFSFVGSVAGTIFLPAGKIILFVPRIILYFYELICKIFGCLPKNILIFGKPELYQIVIYYAILIISCFFIQRKRYHVKYYKIYERMIVSVAVIFSIFILTFRFSEKNLTVTMIDVGQGDGIFLQCKNNINILVDGGSTSISEIGKNRIIPFLKYNAIRRIDYIILSHEDEDHISGQIELIENRKKYGIDIGCFLLPSPDIKSVGDNYKKIEKLINKHNIPVRYIKKGDEINISDINIKCLHPYNSFVCDSPNNYSTTLKITYGKCSMLLTGDLAGNGEEAILPYLDHCDVLKVAHHGSNNSSQREYLSKINPKVSLISSGKNNRYHHPGKELLKRLKEINSQIYNTAECGAIELKTDGIGWHIETYCFSS